MFSEDFLPPKPRLAQCIRVGFFPRAGRQTRLGWVPVLHAVVVLPGLEPLKLYLIDPALFLGASHSNILALWMFLPALPLRRRRAGMAPVARWF